MMCKINYDKKRCKNNNKDKHKLNTNILLENMRLSFDFFKIIIDAIIIWEFK